MTASLRMTGGTETFSFLTFTSDGGFLLDQEMIQEEALETPGVDGRRFRTVFKQHTATTAETVAAYASFGDAVIGANAYRKAKGRLGSVTINAGGRSESFNIHVVDARPQARPGGCVGAAASSGNAAHVICTWVLEPVDFDPSASA